MILNVIGLLIHPAQQWQKIKQQDCGFATCLIKHAVFLAAIPAICGYIGTTMVGWRIGASGTHYLSNQSAGIMAALVFLAMMAGVIGMGWMIQWMSETYGDSQSASKGVILATYVAMPLFLTGFTLLYPVLWVNMLIGLPAVGYSVFLLYQGIPIMMGVSKEKGFLFASALLGMGLVAMVAILAVTVLLWVAGFGPVSVQ